MNKFLQLHCIIVLLLATGCLNKKDTGRWDNACLDPGLPKNIIYHEMNRKDEIYSFSEKPDGSKRTSDVSYLRYGKHEKHDTTYAKFNNCRAFYYAKSDTLLINIGISSGFGGQGIDIKYKNKKFNAAAYLFSDVIIEGETKPEQKVIYQRLTLNKLNYNVGDSLFGKIEFKSMEIDKQGDTVLHVGKGNFRTKVKRIIIQE